VVYPPIHGLRKGDEHPAYALESSWAMDWLGDTLYLHLPCRVATTQHSPDPLDWGLGSVVPGPLVGRRQPARLRSEVLMGYGWAEHFTFTYPAV